MDILHHPAGKASIFLSKITNRANICPERNARLPKCRIFCNAAAVSVCREIKRRTVERVSLNLSKHLAYNADAEQRVRNENTGASGQLPMHGSMGKRKASASPRLALNNPRGDSIEKRLQKTDGRKTPRHWERILPSVAKGAGKPCLSSRSVRRGTKKLLPPDKGQKGVDAALNRMERRYGAKRFRNIFKTITCGNGPEFPAFRAIGKSRIGSIPRTKVFAPIRFLLLKGEATGTPTG